MDELKLDELKLKLRLIEYRSYQRMSCVLCLCLEFKSLLLRLNIRVYCKGIVVGGRIITCHPA